MRKGMTGGNKMMVREDISKEVTFARRPECQEGASYRMI